MRVALPVVSILERSAISHVPIWSDEDQFLLFAEQATPLFVGGNGLQGSHLGFGKRSPNLAYLGGVSRGSRLGTLAWQAE